MPDDSDLYFTNDFQTLSLTPAGADTNVVGGLKEVTIEISYGTFERFFTADSIKRAASKQAELAIPVSVEFAFFDPAFIQEYTDGTGSVADTSDPPEFDFSGEFRSRDNDKKINVGVEKVNFDTIPVFDGSENEFAQWGIDGEGADLTNFEGGTVV